MKPTIKNILKQVGWGIKIEFKNNWNGKKGTYITKPRGNCYRGGGDYHTFCRYLNNNPKIIAYNINELGCIIIFKGIRKIFGFVVLIEDIYFGGYDYKLARLDLKKLFNTFNKGIFKVVDKELFNTIKYKHIADKI